MDDVMRDPELSSEITNFSLKLLTHKLQEARRALHEEEQSSSVLRVEILQYKELAAKQAEGRELSILSNTIKENTRLKRELAELRRNAELVNSKGDATKEDDTAGDGASLQTIEILKKQVQRLEAELNSEHAEVIRTRQELHNVNEAFDQCKAKVKELERDMHDLLVQPNVEVPSVPSVRHKGLEVETLPVNFKEAIEIILSRPCLSPGVNVLEELPPDIRRYCYGGVFYFPNRTGYPVQKMMARIYAPQTEYAVINGKITSGQPKNELHVHINAIRELFVDTPNGICYVGTYRASKVIEMAKDLYTKLEKGPREAIVSRSLATEGHWTNLDQAMQSRMRNLYMQGPAKAEYLVLHYIGFNYALFGALMALKNGANGEKIESSSETTAASPPIAPTTPAPKAASNSQNGDQKASTSTQSSVLWGGVRPSSSASTTKNNTPKSAHKEMDEHPRSYSEAASVWGPSDWS